MPIRAMSMTLMGTALRHACNHRLIGRDWYELSDWNIRFDGNYSGNCSNCGSPVAGVFEETRGDWGRKRVPVRFRKKAVA